MVHKKYIKRGNKVFGPYIYENYRENGVTKTRYLGKGVDKKSKKVNSNSKKSLWVNKKSFGVNKKRFLKKSVSKKTFFILGIVVLIPLLIFSYSFFSGLTGRATLQVASSYSIGEEITGILSLNLKEGELIPASTKVVVDNSGSISEYLLSDLISGELVEGVFYAEEKTISGEGQGYGFVGEKIIYPVINFELQLVGEGFDSGDNEVDNTEVPETTGETEPSVQENEEIIIEENSSEASEEKKENKEKEKDVEEIEEVESESPITGEVIAPKGVPPSTKNKDLSEEGKNKIKGQVSKDNDFIYNLAEGKSVKIKKNSVEVGGEEIGDENIDLKIKEGVAIVSTEYSLSEAGFGEDYLTDEEISFEVDLTELGFVAQEGELKISLVYGAEEIASASEMIDVEAPKGVPSSTENKSLSEEGKIIDLNITREFNVTDVVENITTFQYKAVINRPVKWIKTVKADKDGNVSIELPKKAVNITIKTQEEVTESLNELNEYEEVISDVDKTSLITGQITGEVSLDIEREKGLIYKLFDWLSRIGLTGNAILEDELGDSLVETFDSKIIDVGEILGVANISGEVDVGVEYYTDAPLAVESPLGDDPGGPQEKGKRITISADDEFGYEEILAYSVIERNISINDADKIRIYHLVDEKVVEEVNESVVEKNITKDEYLNILTRDIINNTENVASMVTHKVLAKLKNSESNNYLNFSDNGDNVEEASVALMVMHQPEKLGSSGLPGSKLYLSESPGWGASTPNPIKVRVKFNAYDLDEDGYVDYVEWIVPYLSEQVYEIIYIVKAEHLDMDRNLIADIYEEVKEKDGIWSEVINDNEYVRVTFEQELDNTKDITIYARSFTNESSEVEVYLEGGNESLAVFENIANESWYKIYLTNLSENVSYDVFDLKVLGAVEFDYIVDPSFETMNLSQDAVLQGVTCEGGGRFCHSSLTEMEGLYAYYPMDVNNDSSNIIYDWSGNNYDGVIAGTYAGKELVWGADKGLSGASGTHMFINSADTTCVDIGNSTDFGGNLCGDTGCSFSFWYYYNATSNGDIIGKSDLGDNNKFFYLRDNTGGDIVFSIGQNGNSTICLSSIAVEDMAIDSWNYITAIYDNTIGNITVHKNGASWQLSTICSWESDGINETAWNDAEQTFLGCDDDSFGPRDELTGKFDELMIFNRSITMAEMDQIYAETFSRFVNLGNHTLNQTLVSQNNSVNVTIQHLNQNYSNLSLQVCHAGGCNASVNMEDNVLDTFMIDSGTTMLYLNFTYQPFNNNFWSPILLENITIETFTKDAGVSDDEYPLFSSYWDDNGSVIDSGDGLFNVTIVNTNGTVFLEVGGVNFTATNISGSDWTIYNATANFTSTGEFTYYWHSWGNGTDTNYNNSGARSYTVKARPTQSSPWIGAELETPLNESIVGYWKLNRYGDNNTGTVTDETGKNNGTVHGFDNTSLSGPTYSGRIGGGWNFDGVDDYVETGANVDMGTAYTICTWFKSTETSPSSDCMLGTNDGYLCLHDFNTVIARGRINNSVIKTCYSTNVVIGTDWHHVCYTTTGIVGTNRKIYFNGIDSTSGTCDDIDTDITVSDNLKYIGTRTSTISFFNGTIDEVSIWNTSLSATEIMNMYLDGLANHSATVYTTQDLGFSTNNTADADDDNLFSIFNWYEDNVSIAVLNMPFDSNDSAGALSTKDYSGFGNTGTLGDGLTASTFPFWNATGGIDKDIDGVYSGAYEFDGVDDYVNVSSFDISGTDKITVSFWVKPNTASTGDDLIMEMSENFNNEVDSFLINFKEDETVALAHKGDDAWSQWATTSTLIPNTWTHIVMVLDKSLSSTEAKGYINGILDGSIKTFDGDNTNNFGTQNLYISGRAGSSLFFNGSIDEVQIFNRSLSADEIKQLYLKNYNVLVSEETTKGKSYHAEVTLNDGELDSISYNTSSISILDSLPTSSAPWIGAELETPLNESIVGYWKLNRYGDNITSTVTDETGVNNGTVVNFDNTSLSGPTYSGRIGGGWNFDGVDDYITIPYDQSLNLSEKYFTISAWIYPPSFSYGGDGQAYVYEQGAVYFSFGLVEDTGYIKLTGEGLSDTLIECDAGVNLNEWSHVVGLYNGSDLVIYKDGVEVCKDDTSGNLNNPASTASRIGSHSTAEIRQFNGTIDEVSIWNTSLSSTEIMNLYLDGLANHSATVYTTQDLGFSTNNTADADDDSLTSIFNWYEDNVSIAVLNMPFDSNDSAGALSTKDYSSRGNDGTMGDGSTASTFPFWNATGGIDKDIDGVFSGAYEFDGDGDYVSSSYDSSFDFKGAGTEFTISSWINIKELDEDCGIVSRWETANEQYSFKFDSATNNIKFAIHDGGYQITQTAGNSITTDTWTHVVGVANGLTLLIYINGQQDEYSISTYGTITDIGTEEALRIGRSGSTTEYFNGTIDEVQIFNRSLSAEEIKQLYLKNYNVLVSEETEKDKSYFAEITLNDGYEDSTSYNTSSIDVLDSAPDAPVLNLPSNNSFYSAVPEFNWTNSADVDCYDEQTEILTLNEVSCDEVDCEDENVFCEMIDTESSRDSDKMVINLDSQDKVGYDYEKNKKGSNGVEPNQLKPDYNNCKEQKYLNISVDIVNSRAEMAEWLTQSAETRCPLGCVGSIPTLGAAENFAGINSKKCYKKEWKYFSELEENEKVATLNQETGETEFDVPTAYQVYNYSGEMFRIETENGKLLVSPEHKVYVKIESSEFKLTKILDIYNNYENKELYFLDSENKPISVKSITKENYNGLIYDVDVENDIVLVKRGDLITWSGNSDTVTYYFEVDDDSDFSSVVYVNTSVSETTSVTGDTPTGLTDSKYYWRVLATDASANSSWSETWDFTYDTTFPLINFTSPTPVNASSQSSDSVFVNISTTETNEHSVWVDWNSSLVGYWAMDYYNASTVFDNSSYDNLGTITGAVATSEGARGGGFEFDGDDDRISVPLTQSLNVSNMTISIWIYAFDGDSDIIIENGGLAGAGSNKGFTLRLLNDKIEWDIADGSGNRIVATGTNNLLNDWHHIVAINSGIEVAVYVDGVKQADNESISGYTYDDGNVIIGNRNILDSDFNGTIDEVMIFDRALSSDEIKALYNATSKTGYVNNFTSLGEVEYNYTGYVMDSAGNFNETEMREVMVDATDPVITLINPSVAYSSTATSTTFEFNVTDDSATNCSLIYDGTPELISSSVNIIGGTISHTKTLAVGVHTWSINCTDSANNIANSSSRTATITALAVTPTGGGSSSSGSAPIVELQLDELEITPKDLELYLAVDIEDKGKIALRNLENTIMNILVSQINLKDIVIFEEISFALKPKESKTFEFKIIPPQEPGVYTGKIVFKSEGKSQEVDVVFNVNPKKSLFDIEIEIPQEQREVQEGDTINSQINLIQAGLQDKVDVVLNYEIKDFEGNIYLKESETIAVFKQKTHTNDFLVENLPPGKYVLAVEVIYSGGVAVASSQFVVVDSRFGTSRLVILITILAVAFVLVIIILLMKKYKRTDSRSKSRKRR